MRLDDDGGSPVPDRLAGTAARLDGQRDDTLSPRQCGRCRKLFEGDPTLHQAALAEWYLCPPCRLALLGDRPRRPTTEHKEASVGTHRAP